MAAKFLLACTALLQLQGVLASPVARFPKFERRMNITVDPPSPDDITPVVTELGTITEEELESLFDKRGSRTQPLAPRETGTDGALLTFILGTKQDGCTDFEINGPFTTIHPTLGTSNVLGISATSFGGNTTEIYANDAIVDPGEFTFGENERITKFTVVTNDPDTQFAGFTFETDAGNKYEALSETINNPVYTDLNVGSGILARIRGSDCKDVNGIFGTFGVDFLDELESIGISKIDYEGFTNNIMPTGAGTQLSVGSQVLDNRNSSEKQTITLTTTDAITAQRTITTQNTATVGGSVSIKASAGVPLISSGETTAEARWSIDAMASDAEMDNSITTRAGTFALACPAGKFCTARAFFTQFKLDVNINATFTATAKSGSEFSWVQSGKYKGADSMAMQFNITEVDNVS